MHIFYLFIFLAYTAYAAEPEELLQKMTLEEKAGQLLMVHFNGEEANQEARKLIGEGYVGGFIYYQWANRLSSVQQVRKLSRQLQDLAKNNRLSIPLLIAVDQEGGRICRLSGEGFTQIPSAEEIGQKGPGNAGKWAEVIADELISAGINMNLAPVIDVNSNPGNPVIGNRSYGSNPALVAECASSAYQAYKKKGVIAVFKHFPGHGDADKDSHCELPVIGKPARAFYKIDLHPFRQLAAQADCMMTAHIMVPFLDPVNCATLSKNILTSLLREDLHFKGVTLSDSLVMEGFVRQCGSIEEGAIKAIEAGCDLLILGGKQLNGTKSGYELTVEEALRIHAAILQAVREGQLAEERLNEAVLRILQLKSKYCLL